MTEPAKRKSVIVIGAGFAGVACARTLAKDKDLAVTLIDRNDYHQFQPLLYQVATYQLAPVDIAYPLSEVARHAGIEFRQADVVSVDPATRTVTIADGSTLNADYIVVAAGSQAFFFKTPGARDHAFPLYSLDDARRLRTRILALFDDVIAKPSLADEGGLEFVVVGGGPTGVEVAGAIAEMIHTTLATEYPDLVAEHAHVRLVNHGHVLLAPFSDKAHDFAARTLTKHGVTLMLGLGVTEVGAGHVTLSDGSTIKTRCVVWGGGLKAAELAGEVGLPQGHGGRIDVEPDLRLDGFPGVYVIGDVANIPSPDGRSFPQLGSVAQQSGSWAAKNIIAEAKGKPTRGFHYLDKGIMAMIGRGAAVAEVGAAHHGLHGSIAFMAWLGVHAALMSGVHNRGHAFVEWADDYLSSSHGPYVLDRSEDARIDWGDDVPTTSVAAPGPTGSTTA